MQLEFTDCFSELLNDDELKKLRKYLVLKLTAMQRCAKQASGSPESSPRSSEEDAFNL